MLTFNIPAEVAYDSGWVTLDKFKPLMSESAVVIDWADLTGTLDATIKIYVTTDPGNASLGPLFDTITLNTANSGVDDAYRQIEITHRAVKITSTPNGCTGGDIHGNIVGVQA